MKQKCMCCFNEYEEGISKCPYCGYCESEYEENPYHLPMRTVLKGRYIIGKPLGQGGFGITYAAWDSLLEKKVAIKEYLPTDFATRSVGSPTVIVFNMERAERFQKGMESFLNESRRLAMFNTVPGVVGIFDCFNENNTAYIVMEYLEGKTLGQIIRENGKLPYDKAVYIMLQVLNALDVVHQAGIIHRDVAPDNVFVCDDGSVKLLDFGAARYVTTSHSRSLSMILKMGYAPVEQYSTKGDQGTWTDVYACGATLYYAITGVQPTDSYDRMDETKDDKLAKPSKYVRKLPKNVEIAILNAMNIMPENRTQTAKAFADELEGTIDVERVREKLVHEDTGRIPAWMKANSVAAIIAAVAAVVLIAVGVGAVIVRSDQSNIPDGMTRVPNVVAQEADAAEETLNKSTLKMVIGNRLFDSYYDKMSVIVQNPYAGGVAYQNTLVNVTLGGGTDNMVIMPDLSYYPQENAKELLESLGIFIQYEDGSDDIAADGCVLKQSVKAGEYVKKGDSVILTVNKGDGLTDVSVSTENVKVPDIVGMKMTQAANLLKESKLRISIVEAQYSDEYEAGTVLAQETKAAASVPAGTVINVTVSLGKQQFVVPDVLYMPEQNAKDSLTENHLQFKILYEESDMVAAGVVLRQFPKFGKAVESQTVVTLTVSSGFKVTVPDVVGKKESDAKAALTEARLGCKVVYEPSTTVKQGTVIRQSPNNGNKIEQGSVVEIVVSSGNNRIDVTGVRLNISTVDLNLNDRLTLYSTISPQNATNTVVTWLSSNSKIASVDGNGIVTANAFGSAVITVKTADGGFTASCDITVSANLMIQKTAGKYPLDCGGKGILKVTCDDASVLNGTIQWTSSNTRAIWVTGNGTTATIEGKNAGRTTITVSAGNKSASVEISSYGAWIESDDQPTGDNYEIEEKTFYEYKDSKRVKALSAPGVSGMNLVRTQEAMENPKYTDWSGWSSTIEGDCPADTETTDYEYESVTYHGYYCYTCPVCGGHMPARCYAQYNTHEKLARHLGYGSYECEGVIPDNYRFIEHPIQPVSSTVIPGDTTKKLVWVNGEQWFYDTDDDASQTYIHSGYKSRTRQKYYLFTYEGSWEDSENPISDYWHQIGTEEYEAREVKTTTFFRYRQKP